MTIVKPNPNVIFKRLGEEMVLFNLDTDRFYELNETGARFWELLNEGRTDTELREQMSAEFAVEAEDLAAQANAFLTSLRKESLIQIDE